mmetsp:Transcript_25318/g.55503  ORF Transcript_25318/g.55503 Transcript_25318/m.55503 type:complete len:236 (-) Transcript_25318:262-969(-)
MAFHDLFTSPHNIISGLWYTVIVSSLLAEICLIVVMLKDLSPSTAFAWHPILMCLSFLVFMSQGMNQYWVGNQLLSQQDLTKSQHYHAIYQIVAFLCAIGGWSAIYIAHSHGKGHVAKGDPLVKVIHTWLGYFVLLGATIQSVVGIVKYKSLPRRFAKWHGALYAGPMIWFCGCINIFLGVTFWESQTYTLGVKFITSLCAVWTVSVTIFFKVYVLKKNSSHQATLIRNSDVPLA